MDLKRELAARAAELGFARIYVVRPERFERWEAYVRSRDNLASMRTICDPFIDMPECRAIVLLVWPYQPYELDPPVAAPSAYYVASNASRIAESRLVDWLRERGHLAVDGCGIPLKALAERAGAGRYGRNGIIAAPALGSRVALPAILTGAEMELDQPYEGHEFSDECRSCRACVSACPVDALDGEGGVDGTKCLRALPMDRPLPDECKPLVGGSLLGCDLCQDCCPRNAGIGRVPVPEDVLKNLALERLLAGDMSGVGPLLGVNYARKKRMQARACLVAANLGRRDCLPLISALADDDAELVRDAASWALDRLERP